MMYLAGGHSGIKPRAVRSSACQDHSRLHNRLDVVEKVTIPLQYCLFIPAHCTTVGLQWFGKATEASAKESLVFPQTHTFAQRP